MAIRFDTAKIDAAETTDAGYLRAPARFTRAGVFIYRGANGSLVRELRPPEEVFHEDSMKSLLGVPLTDQHPSAGVDSKKAKHVVRGSVGTDVRQDGVYLSGSLSVYDEELIEKIKTGGAREISCGYTCTVEQSAGVWEGERYDAIQKNIRYNHAAVVERGRAGPEVSIRMDGEDVRVAVVADSVLPEEKRSMKIKIEGTEYECSEELAKAFETLASKQDRALLDVEKARADALDLEVKKLKDEKSLIPQLVKARVALERDAAKHVPAEKFDSLSDIEIKKAVVQKIVPALKLDDASEDYVSGAYLTALQIADARAVTAVEKVKAASTGRADEAPVKSPREKMLERQAQAWKGNK